jgi:hypothetical protein
VNFVSKRIIIMFGNMEENAMGIFPEMLWCAVPVTIGLLAVGCYYLITGVSRGPETVQGPKQLPKQNHKPEEMVLNDGQLPKQDHKPEEMVLNDGQLPKQEHKPEEMVLNDGQLPKQDHKPKKMVLNDGQLQTPSTRRGERKRNQPDRLQVEHHKKNYYL